MLQVDSGAQKPAISEMV